MQLVHIAASAADAMKDPEAFTNQGVAYTREGKPASVFSDEAVTRDALGWVLKKAYDLVGTSGMALKASEMIGTVVYQKTGQSLVSLNDTVPNGRERAIAALQGAASIIRMRKMELPQAPRCRTSLPTGGRVNGS